MPKWDSYLEQESEEFVRIKSSKKTKEQDRGEPRKNSYRKQRKQKMKEREGDQ